MAYESTDPRSIGADCWNKVLKMGRMSHYEDIFRDMLNRKYDIYKFDRLFMMLMTKQITEQNEQIVMIHALTKDHQHDTFKKWGLRYSNTVN